MNHRSHKFWGLTGLVILAVALSLVGGVDAAQADDRAGILFILDCSGSMWGRVEGQPKISLAKEVMTEILGQVPDKTALGFMAYGHRRKGDCKDIELVAQLGAPAADIGRAVKGLTAKGKTPLAASLTEAGRLLEKREAETTVVLISDGLETCGGDPCKIAGDLKKKGLKLVIHVVGFDVDKAAVKQLECIAAAGGGSFFKADNLAQLKEALNKVKESVVEKKPLPPQPKAQEAEAKKSKSKRIKIKGPGTVVIKPASWVKMPRYWGLADIETGKIAVKGSGDSLRVKAGEYRIVWRQSEHEHVEAELTEVVTVESGKTKEVAIDTGLRLSLPKSITAPRWWGLVEPGGKKPIWGCRELGPQVVPAGDYRIYWHQDEHRSRPLLLGQVTLEAGKLNDVVVDSGLSLQPADWIKKGPKYYYLKDDQGQTVGLWSDLKPQLAPPGEYTLVYRPTEHEHNDIIWGPVTIPEHGFAEVAINSGLKFIHQPKAKPPYAIFLVDLDHKGREIMIKESWDPVPVPPGRYRLDWRESQHGNSRTTLADEIEVEPGAMMELEM